MSETSTLNLHDLPAVDDKAAIWAFAMSFHGYEAYGSFEAAAVASKERSRDSVAALRNELLSLRVPPGMEAPSFTYSVTRNCGRSFSGCWPLDSQVRCRPAADGRDRLVLRRLPKARRPAGSPARHAHVGHLQTPDTAGIRVAIAGMPRERFPKCDRTTYE